MDVSFPYGPSMNTDKDYYLTISMLIDGTLHIIRKTNETSAGLTYYFNAFGIARLRIELTAYRSHIGRLPLELPGPALLVQLYLPGLKTVYRPENIGFSESRLPLSLKYSLLVREL